MKENAQEPKRLKKPNIFARILALLVTAALVLGALAAVVYRDQLTPGAVRRWLAYQNMTTSETGESVPFTHAGGDKLSVAYLNSGVVTASAAGAHYYGLDGAAFVNRVLSMDNPVLSTSGTTAVAYDAGSQALFAFRDGEEYFSLSLDSSADLLSARANDSGALEIGRAHV